MACTGSPKAPLQKGARFTPIRYEANTGRAPFFGANTRRKPQNTCKSKFLVGNATVFAPSFYHAIQIQNRFLETGRLPLVWARALQKIAGLPCRWLLVPY